MIPRKLNQRRSRLVELLDREFLEVQWDVDALSILFRDATGCEMGSLLDLPLKKGVLCRRTGIHHVV